MQAGFVTGATGTVIVKEVPAESALTNGVPMVDAAVLHVTLRRVPRPELNWSLISLFAVTAVVLTTVVVSVASTTTAPAAAALQAASPAESEQFVVVL